MNGSDPVRQRAFSALAAMAASGSGDDIATLFRHEPDRMRRFTVDAAGLHIDFSRQRITAAALDALLALARNIGVEGLRSAQLRGDPVNATEQRRVLHTALRRDPARPLLIDGVDLMPGIADGLARMREFTRDVQEGRWTGHRGARIRDVVSIGIGGSHLGPRLACEALQGWRSPMLRVHFLSNLDPDAWGLLHPTLDPASTLFIIASKSWRTMETDRNARAARRWLTEAGIAEADLGRQLIGVTANPAGARAFGLRDAGIFPFSDWVGGRYSLWSAIGLPVMLAIGADAFDTLLLGARSMDAHFESAPLARNAPVLLALVCAWNRLGPLGHAEAVIPYCEALRLLPAYLQQLLMESNGKSVGIGGEPLAWPTAPLVWGAAGTDAQHSFFQALHQGSDIHPVEFLLTIPAVPDPEERDIALLANGIAQAEALMRGRTLAESLASLLADGVEPEAAQRLAPHCVHPGNRPSTTLLLGRLTPDSLGALIALYEHKAAVLGWLWGINSYDQWGVEFGKRLAGNTEAILSGRQALPSGTDPSTAALITRVARALAARPRRSDDPPSASDAARSGQPAPDHG